MKGQIGKNMEKLAEDIVTNLQDPGWTVIGVEHRWAYTVGLWHNYAHPEIIVFGLPMQTAHGILNDIGGFIKNDNLRFQEGPDYTSLAKGYPLRFIDVVPDDHFGIGINFYGQRKFKALQLCWPDKEYRFPWDKDFDPSMKLSQPLLTRALSLQK